MLRFSRKQNRFPSDYFQKREKKKYSECLSLGTNSGKNQACPYTNILRLRAGWQLEVNLGSYCYLWWHFLPLCSCMHFPLTSDMADKLVSRLLTTYKCSGRKPHRWFPHKMFKKEKLSAWNTRTTAWKWFSTNYSFLGWQIRTVSPPPLYFKWFFRKYLLEQKVCKSVATLN